MKTIEMRLAIDYPNVPIELRIRYAKMLHDRAVRFYLENTFDGTVIEEDLYEEYDSSGTHYPNLDHSEVIEGEYKQDLKKLLTK